MSKTIKQILDEMTPEQQTAAYTVFAAAIDDVDNNLQHSGFDRESTIKNIFKEAKRDGSLKDAFLSHASTYGISNISMLFPEATNIDKTPRTLDNKVEWVNSILSAVSKQPFARVKTMFAELSPETIRAKGYNKGDRKIEDVFTLLKRSTDPTTIYKKEKIDRDDVMDITDLDVVAWIKDIMKMKLDQELARAILIGDGRLNSDQFKIDESCIRPVYSDDDLFTIKTSIQTGLSTDAEKAKAFITACVKARKSYRGSGNPTLYTTEDLIAEMLLLEDTTGRRLYTSIEDLKSILRVSNIIAITELVGLVRPTTDSKKHSVMGIIVNLSDYSIGTNKGGQVSLFDDFDIDYNQQKYLIETRCSGALTVPYSAMVIENVTTP